MRHLLIRGFSGWNKRRKKNHAVYKKAFGKKILQICPQYKAIKKKKERDCCERIWCLFDKWRATVAPRVRHREPMISLEDCSFVKKKILKCHRDSDTPSSSSPPSSEWIYTQIKGKVPFDSVGLLWGTHSGSLSGGSVNPSRQTLGFCDQVFFVFFSSR